MISTFQRSMPTLRFLQSVRDSHEGWVEAWSFLIDSGHAEPGTHYIHISTSPMCVRPYGAPLKTFGCTASGAAPLVSSLRVIAGILNGVRYSMNSLEVMEIDHAIASAVVAGGARRSARMSLKHWADPDIFDFINFASPTTREHWSTNISIEIDDEFSDALARDDEKAWEVLNITANGMALNGEPGFVNTGKHSVGERTRIRMVNPCAEASLSFDPTDGAGESCTTSGCVNLDAFGTDLEGACRAFCAHGTLSVSCYPQSIYPDAAASRIEAKNLAVSEWVSSGCRDGRRSTVRDSAISARI